MVITYGDLPSLDACIKLTMVSFSSPKKNLDVYKFVNDLKVYQEAFSNEQNKLLKQYGVPQKDNPNRYYLGDNSPIYYAKLDELKTSQIDNLNINFVDLSEKDFSDNNCIYSNNKNMWLNGNDIIEILEFIKKLKET